MNEPDYNTVYRLGLLTAIVLGCVFVGFAIISQQPVFLVGATLFTIFGYCMYQAIKATNPSWSKLKICAECDNLLKKIQGQELGHGIGCSKRCN